MEDAGNLTYKEEHERFVTGHNGTTIFEIATLVSVAPATMLIRGVVVSQMSKALSAKSWVAFIVDFCILVLPLTSCCMILADHSLTLVTSCLVLFVTFLAFSNRLTYSVLHSTFFCRTFLNDLLDVPISSRLSFITNFRAYVNLASAILILAVDFVIFPRRFCKTETFGTGLMDVGVGAFVLANAIVSPEARGKYDLVRSRSEIVPRLARSFASTLPLWVLGFARLIALKNIGYPEHVSEYGVHWNFFFTLAIVRVLSTLVLCFVSHRISWLVAICVAVFYELALQRSLKRYVLEDGAEGSRSRLGILNANREGIFSCFGYLAIYFASVQIGQYLLRPRLRLRSNLNLLGSLFALDFLFWVSLAVCQTFVDPVSRRLANLSYVIWMMAYNVQLLTQFLAVDIILFVCFEKSPSSGVEKENQTDVKASTNVGKVFHLLSAIGRNGLFYFLLANLLTGSVNVLVRTTAVTQTTAFLTVAVYLLVLSIVTAILDCYEINVKFW